MQLFGRQKREGLRQIEAHLAAKHAQCAGARAVAARDAIVENVLQKIEILFHAACKS